MKLPALITILAFAFSAAWGQQNILVFKKRNKDIHTYWTGSLIVFQLKDKQWQKGEITKIQNDSFYVRPTVIRYSLMGTDTVHFSIMGYAVTDVFALPNKGILISYINGRFQISGTGGHVHWYWVKSGWIFRVGAAGYAGLHIANGIINNDFSFSGSKTQLFAATAVFLGGVLLHKTYKPYLQIRKKYHLEIINYAE